MNIQLIATIIFYAIITWLFSSLARELQEFRKELYRFFQKTGYNRHDFIAKKGEVMIMVAPDAVNELLHNKEGSDAKPFFTEDVERTCNQVCKNIPKSFLQKHKARLIDIAIAESKKTKKTNINKVSEGYAPPPNHNPYTPWQKSDD